VAHQPDLQAQSDLSEISLVGPRGSESSPFRKLFPAVLILPVYPIHSMKSLILRDRLWHVESESALGGDRLFFRLRDPATGEASEALCPPDEFQVVANAGATLTRSGVVPYHQWALRHAALKLAACDDVPLAALHSGRIIPEAYQFVAASRLLHLPKPSLLIADDVGLGKTVEAGLCMMELIARGRAKRILLVVPPGLIHQWRDDEMQDNFGLRFHTVENSSALERAQTALAEGLNPWVFLDRIITSIDYLKRREVSARALEKPWDIIVVDEAHCLAESGTPRNPYQTLRTRLGQKLRDAARCLILLTATPHNGHRHSFRSLLELVAPTDATFEGDRETVQRRIGRSMIRRLKSQIYRTGSDGTPAAAFVPREPVRGMAVGAATAADREVFRLVSGYCAKVTIAARGTDQEDLVSFAMQIIKKRMLSSRAALTSTVAARIEALASRTDPVEPPSRAEIRELQSDLPLGESEHERIAQRVVKSALPAETKRRNEEKKRLKIIAGLLSEVAGEPDAKFAALIAELRTEVLPVSCGKAIIFTEYVDTLESLRTALEAQPDFKGLWVSLTGGTSPKQRLAILERFSQPGTRFLLATDAASEGLNLQHHCCRLYHLELPWNPNRLEQRNGRIDRHGQKRPPRIGYFYYADSPEDRVLNRLVQRIVQMQDDKVSTPDILGLLSEGRIDRALGALDPRMRRPRKHPRHRSSKCSMKTVKLLSAKCRRCFFLHPCAAVRR